MKLRTRFAILLCALVVLSVALCGGGLLIFEGAYLKKENLAKIRVIQESVEKAVEETLIFDDRLSLVSHLKFLKKQWPPLRFARARWIQGGRQREVSVGQTGSFPKEWILERAVPHPNLEKTIVAVDVAIDRDLLQKDIRSSLRRLGREILIIAVVLVSLGIVLTAMASYHLSKPLKMLSDAAREIGAGRLGKKVEYRRNDELGDVISAFNRMSGRLEELDRMKKDFVSSVTHELRSPLAAVESILNILRPQMEKLLAGPSTLLGGVRSTSPAQAGRRGGIEPGMFGEYLDRAQLNIRRLGIFIDNLLDAAKIEKGKMEFNPVGLRLAPAVQEVISLFEARFREKGVEIMSRLSEECPGVKADPDGLRRILVNLVSNALKFTERGGNVEIVSSGAVPAGAGDSGTWGTSPRDGARGPRSTGGAKGGADPDWVEISVRDNGAGIRPEDLDRVFEQFSQGLPGQGRPPGGAPPRRQKGTGLGLYVVKSIVEAHGGKVKVRSKLGEGTTLTFTLPSG